MFYNKIDGWDLLMFSGGPVISYLFTTKRKKQKKDTLRRDT